MLPVNIRFDFITNSKVQHITSLDCKHFHINILGCKNLTFEQVTISALEDSANTDGIHIGRSQGINIINTRIGTGDDCISIGDGSEEVRITGVACGPGPGVACGPCHGISIGSLGKYENEEPVNYSRFPYLVSTKVKISNVGFKNIKGTSTTPVAVELYCSSGIPCENVELCNIDLTYSGKEGPAKLVLTNVKPKITGILNPKVGN
ncbi:hypothetical protein JCGZ_26694 [Jatropha curcas]|uniref:Polygalacturonase n=1 Tax=Jatropha curcas TaxID=180498 RepID=A0A067JW98_JATCU|nr:hypothetical protein JCGZ_26694 [Jatropha curcas]